MQGYRGEITVADLPKTLDSLDNPFGDWEAGPGLWYLRARDKLKLVIYTGDLYMGNSGSFHIPFSNGLFSTLPAIFNISGHDRLQAHPLAHLLRGVAFDLSEHGDHGTLHGHTHLGTGAFTTTIFQGGDAAVWVKPSTTLERLGSVRPQVRFHWEPRDRRPPTTVATTSSRASSLSRSSSTPTGRSSTILNALGPWPAPSRAPAW